jgi:pSer/pThr/pTyr-binding forkhead associated (FHA) protein
MSEIVLVEVTEDGTRGETHTCAGPQIKVGKLGSSGLKLDHPSVGRMHATITFEADGSVSLIDLGSVQGTYVNDQKVNKCLIQQHDVVKFGDVMLVVERIGEAEASGSGADERDLDSLKARIDQLRRVTEISAQRRAAAHGSNGESKSMGTRLGEMIGAGILGSLVGDEELAQKLDGIAALVNGFCDATEKLRETLPADRVAEELDGIVEVFMPTLHKLGARLEQLSDYTEATIERGVLFRAGLVKKLKDEFELSEDDAMEIVRSMSNEMKEQVERFTKK